MSVRAPHVFVNEVQVSASGTGDADNRGRGAQNQAQQITPRRTCGRSTTRAVRVALRQPESYCPPVVQAISALMPLRTHQSVLQKADERERQIGVVPVQTRKVLLEL